MEMTTHDAPLGTWTDRLATPVPDPGGGAAAAVVTAIGAAVAAMADGYVDDDRPDAARLREARTEAWAVADRDAQASADLAEVFAVAPAQRDPERCRRILEQAAASATAVTDLVVGIAPALPRIAERCPDPLRPDIAVAARLLAAGARAGAVNVRVNARGCQDAGSGTEVVAALRERERLALAAADALDELAAAVTESL
ncbi:cyclodeaminase/cyclohydrolase family protein [Microbacterium xanthum]|uniref:cyclodeaminase/cyclohydrolase family protein n=1 Tax=Microbacterium xanthum TaxID=3079794 RepID=UPI002AD331DA|nr:MULTISPECIES: cyclodeaminase/cyclohydrolase family protein [unclassified Microbacterium]MDZ8170968.1 cyclodeaminase/cyclohydrolase family protein [Microbacterium sp. KSW-48]MDZ8201485.1 cyclodeaminase/cyclohydrolase family protein [Microbacterium sp. SSW1-59]